MRLQVHLRDETRELTAELELELFPHPSETVEFLHARALAYCLSWREGLRARGELCRGDEPAFEAPGPDGRRALWVDVGRPDARRLARAARSADRVQVYCRGRRELESLRLPRLPRGADLELVALPRPLLAELAAGARRRARWDLARTGERLVLETGGQRLEGTLLVRRPGRDDRE